MDSGLDINNVLRSIHSFGHYMMTVDMFPVFFIAHFAIGNIVIREDSKHLGSRFPQKHPFTSWLCTLLIGLSGAFLASFLFGNPLIDVLKENYLIAFFTVEWYIMNFSPFDIVYKIVNHPAVMLPFCLLQECLRIRFLYLGVQTAAKIYPNAPLIIMVGGIIRGNGYGFIKIVERLVRGHWNPETNEFLDLTYFAKSGAMATLIFVLHHYKVFKMEVEFLYLAVLFMFLIGRLIVMIGGVRDPLAPLQAPFCRLLFGSWDETVVVPNESIANGGGENKSSISKDSVNGKKNRSKKTD